MKRFTESSKWSDPWFRKLPIDAKCLWLWLLDNCDCAGIIDADLDLAGFQIGLSEPLAKALERLGDRVENMDGKLFIRKFIPYQYGPSLNPSSTVHRGVIKRLQLAGIQSPVPIIGHQEKETLLKAFPNPLESVKDKDKDKEKDKDKDKAEKAKSKSRPNDRSELDAFFAEVGLSANDAEYAWHHWEGKGWRNGTAAIKDWKATVRSWKAAGYWPSQKGGVKAEPKSSSMRDRLPDDWREQASAILERTVTEEWDELSYDDKGDVGRWLKHPVKSA